jgi:lipopolysaccharide export system protein LptA
MGKNFHLPGMGTLPEIGWMFRPLPALLLAAAFPFAAAEPPPVEAYLPIRDFFLPSFNGDGVKAWDAHGSEAEVRDGGKGLVVHDLYVRIFDERDGSGPRIVLESPKAEVLLEKKQIFGENFIHVVGNLFTATGDRWTFFGEDRSVLLDKNVHVFFETNLAKAIASDVADGDGGGFTAVSSESLQLSDSGDGFMLEFSQSVTVRADDLLLTCDRLEVETICERPMATALLVRPAGEMIRVIRADGHAAMRDSQREIWADLAEIFPREGLVVLSGNATVASNAGVLRGQRIVLRQKDTRILVDEANVPRNAFSIEMD